MKNLSRKLSNLQHSIEHRPVIKASLGLVFGAILGLMIGNMIAAKPWD